MLRLLTPSDWILYNDGDHDDASADDDDNNKETFVILSIKTEHFYSAALR